MIEGPNNIPEKYAIPRSANAERGSERFSLARKVLKWTAIGAVLYAGFALVVAAAEAMTTTSISNAPVIIAQATAYGGLAGGGLAFIHYGIYRLSGRG